MSILKVDYGTISGGVATGEIDNSSGSTSAFVVHTGVKNIKRFNMFCGLNNGSTSFFILIDYNNTVTETDIQLVCACGAGASISQSVVKTSGFPTQQTNCSVITNITTDGDVTIAPGSSGTWWKIKGTWYAE